MRIERTLISEEEIATRIADLGAQISADYEGKDLMIGGVLKGAFMVMADLSRHIHLPVDIDGRRLAPPGPESSRFPGSQMWRQGVAAVGDLRRFLSRRRRITDFARA